MKPRDWWCLLGVILLLGLLCWFIYMLGKKETSSPHFHPSLQTEPNVENSRFAQEWQRNFLSNRNSQCLDYLPTFHGEFWNNTPASKFNNCYAYAFRNMDLNRNHKPQPGELSQKEQVPKHEYSCDRIFDNVVSDHPMTMKWPLNIPCPCGYFKGMLVLSQNPADYHFLREDSNGYWSHKLGGGAATQYDASGQLITDPFKANLNYGKYNYDKRCFAFCTPYEKQDTQW